MPVLMATRPSAAFWAHGQWIGRGNIHKLSPDDLGHGYRSCSVPADYIFTEARYQGEAGDPEALKAEMDDVAAYREENQPTKERTGGSTFRNP